jgi:hypothetical protein
VSLTGPSTGQPELKQRSVAQPIKELPARQKASQQHSPRTLERAAAQPKTEQQKAKIGPEQERQRERH